MVLQQEKIIVIGGFGSSSNTGEVVKGIVSTEGDLSIAPPEDFLPIRYSPTYRLQRAFDHNNPLLQVERG